MTRPPISLLCFLSACSAGVILLPEPKDSDSASDTGGDTAPAQDTSGPDSDSGDTSVDTAPDSPTVDSDPKNDTADLCDHCTGILDISPDTVSLKADGTDTSSTEVTLSGWTTGIQVRCSADLPHVTSAVSDTDTSESGSTVVRFGLTGAFAGTEEGYCVASSDYGALQSIYVKASPCPDCSGIVECDEYELMINTASYSSAHSTSTTCRGTATGIEVTCEGGDHFAFYYELSDYDTTDTGKFTLTLGVSDGAYAYEHGTCTVTSDQGDSIEFCWWENDGRVTDPC